jgi:hypothetical protein
MTGSYGIVFFAGRRISVQYFAPRSQSVRQDENKWAKSRRFLLRTPPK